MVVDFFSYCITMYEHWYVSMYQCINALKKKRGGGVVPHEAHNLGTRVRVVPPLPDFFLIVIMGMICRRSSVG